MDKDNFIEIPLTINPNRIELDEAYMQMAEIWAKRSKANRLQVGALLVKGQQIISDGYNGMPAGMIGADEVCEYLEEVVELPNQGDPYGSSRFESRTKPEVLHAEANAILKLAASGHGSSEGATLYTTYSPCPECAKLIKQAKIKRVVYRNHYRRPEGVELLTKWGITCQQLFSPERLQPVLAAGPEDAATKEDIKKVFRSTCNPSNHLPEPPVLVNQVPFRKLRTLTYEGMKFGGHHGLAIDTNGDVFILNEKTKYLEEEGYWGGWPINQRFNATVTDSHLVLAVAKELTEVSQALTGIGDPPSNHDWKETFSGGHNNETDYECTKCGATDWTAPYSGPPNAAGCPVK